MLLPCMSTIVIVNKKKRIMKSKKYANIDYQMMEDRLPKDTVTECPITVG